MDILIEEREEDTVDKFLKISWFGMVAITGILCSPVIIAGAIIGYPTKKIYDKYKNCSR